MKKMKKKLFTLGLAATLGLSMGTTVFAADENENENKVEDPTSIPIPSTGRIGLTAVEDGDEGDFAPDTLVSVSVPARTSWWVSAETGAEVMSADFNITNNSVNANLEVTFDGYKQIPTSGVNLDGLTLNLTGALAADGLGLDITNKDNNEATGTFSTILYSEAANGGTAGDTWTFGFGGDFVGNMPAIALTPEFELNLTFEVYSYTVR